MRRTTLATAILAALLVAGCTAYGSPDTAPGDGTGDGPAGAAVVTDVSPNVTVTMRNIAFGSSPTVRPGAVVRFVNEDATAHTVTIASAGVDARVPGGDSVMVRFTASGTYRVVCTIHPGMETTVTVSG